MHQITGESHTNSIVVKIKDDANTQVAEKSLTELLKARHGTEDFFMNNSDSIKEMVESTTGTMTLLISSIAVISLVVGGIGRDEHHAGFRYRAHQRNRRPHGNRRTPQQYFATVSD